MNQYRAKELTEAHWKYIEGVMHNLDVEVDKIQLISFHYKTAMEHGYGHGYEDAINDLSKEE